MIRGRTVLVFLLVCCLAALGSVSAQPQNASRAGWISDEGCGARAVFVADEDQAIWIVENPEVVKNFPAAHVRLAGNFDSAKKTVQVEKITPSAQ